MSVPFELSLQYQLHPGWLQPFVEGLRQGSALGRQCDGCQRTTLPPTRVCACGSHSARWVRLSGVADIQSRTSGRDGCSALVQFHGAHNLAVAALRHVADHETQAVLVATPDAPALILTSALGN